MCRKTYVYKAHPRSPGCIYLKRRKGQWRIDVSGSTRQSMPNRRRSICIAPRHNISSETRFYQILADFRIMWTKLPRPLRYVSRAIDNQWPAPTNRTALRRTLPLYQYRYYPKYVFTYMYYYHLITSPKATTDQSHESEVSCYDPPSNTLTIATSYGCSRNFSTYRHIRNWFSRRFEGFPFPF